MSRKLGVSLKNTRKVLSIEKRKNNNNGLNCIEKYCRLITLGKTSRITKIKAGKTDSGATDAPPNNLDINGKLVNGRNKNIAANIKELILEQMFANFSLIMLFIPEHKKYHCENKTYNTTRKDHRSTMITYRFSWYFSWLPLTDI